MNLTTTRGKVEEALTLLRRGNPHRAHEILVEMITTRASDGDVAALAANWLDMGLVGMAMTELEGYLRKTSFEAVTAEIRKEMGQV